MKTESTGHTFITSPTKRATKRVTHHFNTMNTNHTFALMRCLLLLLVGAGLSASAQERLLGGDISLLPTYEQRGTRFLDTDGHARPALEIFSQAGWNAMRVRLFVDPQNAPQSNRDEGVCQDLDYIVPLCRQIKQAGMRLMLDFHYSDTWADPAKQFTPRRWQHLKPRHLADSVYAYTRRVLLRLQAEQLSPDLIQVGNEITFGMLWPTGRTNPQQGKRWTNLIGYLQAGCRACREVCPQAKIIIHTEHVYDLPATLAYYERLRRARLSYDVIGLSYYPMWHKDLATLSNSLDTLAVRFPDKELMIVETAFYYSHLNDRWEPQPDHYADLYPITPEGQRLFTRQLVDVLLRHPRVTGLFWWFPEENESGPRVIGSWINRGLFDNRSGQVLPALGETTRFIKP